MSARHGKHFHRGRICKGLHVEFTAPDLVEGTAIMISCEWDPRMPAALSPKMRRNYDKERDLFVRKYLGYKRMKNGTDNERFN